MPELIPVLSAGEIRLLVAGLARRISADYRGRDRVLIGVLMGSFVFLADLVVRSDARPRAAATDRRYPAPRSYRDQPQLRAGSHRSRSV